MSWKTSTPVSPEVEERTILSVPLYHVAGMQSMLASVYGGRTTCHGASVRSGGMAGAGRAEKVNRAMMVPTMLKQLIDHPIRQTRPEQLKVITYGASPMTLDLITKGVGMFPGRQSHQRLWPDRDGLHHYDPGTGRPHHHRYRRREGPENETGWPRSASRCPTLK